MYSDYDPGIYGLRPGDGPFEHRRVLKADGGTCRSTATLRSRLRTLSRMRRPHTSACSGSAAHAG